MSAWIVGADRLEAYRNQHGETQELALDADGLTVTAENNAVYERYGTTVLVPMDLLREMLAAFDAATPIRSTSKGDGNG